LTLPILPILSLRLVSILTQGGKLKLGGLAAVTAHICCRKALNKGLSRGLLNSLSLYISPTLSLFLFLSLSFPLPLVPLSLLSLSPSCLDCFVSVRQTTIVSKTAVCRFLCLFKKRRIRETYQCWPIPQSPIPQSTPSKVHHCKSEVHAGVADSFTSQASQACLAGGGQSPLLPPRRPLRQ